MRARTRELTGYLDAARLDTVGWFDGHEDYDFMSNFHPSPVRFVDPEDWQDRSDGYGTHVQTVEHAFQASKAVRRNERRAILDADDPGLAKALGQRCELRPDWESVKLDVMRHYVRKKFWLHANLRQRLIATAPTLLVEGNTWGDRFWGIADGDGLNWLGLVLMEVRNELRTAEGFTTRTERLTAGDWTV